MKRVMILMAVFLLLSSFAAFGVGDDEDGEEHHSQNEPGG